MTELVESLFLQEFEKDFAVLSCARLVSSKEEAFDRHNHQRTEQDKRRNRFALAYYCIGMKQTSFMFSLYVDILHKKIYAFFDEISNPSMLLENKEVPFLTGTFSMDDFANDLDYFLDYVFTPTVRDYYSSSCLSFENLTDTETEGFFSLAECEIFAFFGMLDALMSIPRRIAFYPGDLYRPEADKVPIFFSPAYFVDLKIYSDSSGRFVFITDGAHIWSVNKVTFDSFCESYNKAQLNNEVCRMASREEAKNPDFYYSHYSFRLLEA